MQSNNDIYDINFNFENSIKILNKFSINNKNYYLIDDNNILKFVDEDFEIIELKINNEILNGIINFDYLFNFENKFYFSLNNKFVFSNDLINYNLIEDDFNFSSLKYKFYENEVIVTTYYTDSNNKNETINYIINNGILKFKINLRDLETFKLIDHPDASENLNNNEDWVFDSSDKEIYKINNKYYYYYNFCLLKETEDFINFEIKNVGLKYFYKKNNYYFTILNHGNVSVKEGFSIFIVTKDFINFKFYNFNKIRIRERNFTSDYSAYCFFNIDENTYFENENLICLSCNSNKGKTNIYARVLICNLEPLSFYYENNFPNYDRSVSLGNRFVFNDMIYVNSLAIIGGNRFNNYRINTKGFTSFSYNYIHGNKSYNYNNRPDKYVIDFLYYNFSKHYEYTINSSQDEKPFYIDFTYNNKDDVMQIIELNISGDSNKSPDDSTKYINNISLELKLYLGINNDVGTIVFNKNFTVETLNSPLKFNYDTLLRNKLINSIQLLKFTIIKGKIKFLDFNLFNFDLDFEDFISNSDNIIEFLLFNKKISEINDLGSCNKLLNNYSKSVIKFISNYIDYSNGKYFYNIYDKFECFNCCINEDQTLSTIFTKYYRFNAPSYNREFNNIEDDILTYSILSFEDNIPNPESNGNLINSEIKNIFINKKKILIKKNNYKIKFFNLFQNIKIEELTIFKKYNKFTSKDYLNYDFKYLSLNAKNLKFDGFNFINSKLNACEINLDSNNYIYNKSKDIGVFNSDLNLKNKNTILDLINLVENESDYLNENLNYILDLNEFNYLGSHPHPDKIFKIYNFEYKNLNYNLIIAHTKYNTYSGNEANTIFIFREKQEICNFKSDNLPNFDEILIKENSKGFLITLNNLSIRESIIEYIEDEDSFNFYKYVYHLENQENDIYLVPEITDYNFYNGYKNFQMKIYLNSELSFEFYPQDFEFNNNELLLVNLQANYNIYNNNFNNFVDFQNLNTNFENIDYPDYSQYKNREISNMIKINFMDHNIEEETDYGKFKFLNYENNFIVMSSSRLNNIIYYNILNENFKSDLVGLGTFIKFNNKILIKSNDTYDPKLFLTDKNLENIILLNDEQINLIYDKGGSTFNNYITKSGKVYENLIFKNGFPEETFYSNIFDYPSILEFNNLISISYLNKIFKR